MGVVKKQMDFWGQSMFSIYFPYIIHGQTQIRWAFLCHPVGQDVR